MGSNTSKVNHDTTNQNQKHDSETSGNPDPRSPTPEISRTPLQGKGGAKHNITKNVDLRKTFENGQEEGKLIHNNPILSAVIKNHLQSYDPRSPTQDFERTPIVIGSTIDDLKNDKNVLRAQNIDNFGSPNLCNDNEYDESYTQNKINSDIVPKKLCDGFMNLSFNDTFKEGEGPLGSSTASSDSIEKNVSINGENKNMKLLETNFDYVEEFEDSEENIEIENNQETTFSDEEVQENGDYEAESVSTQIPKFRVLPQDPRSPTNGIERTPIVVAKIEEESGDDNVEEMSDDTLIKVLQNTNAELLQSVTKPEGILIYEDETSDLNDTPKKSKSASGSGSRTPLSCMKNKTDAVHARSKSVNTLYDPKCQNISAIPKRMSHIPRLKSLSKPTKVMPTGSSISLQTLSKTSVIIGDCENTPPHSHRDKWDKDTSIVL